MRQSSWIPSLVPAIDETVYLVADDFGAAGSAWREADVTTADLETVIRDLLAGEYRRPLRVVAFNTTQPSRRNHRPTSVSTSALTTGR